MRISISSLLFLFVIGSAACEKVATPGHSDTTTGQSGTAAAPLAGAPGTATAEASEATPLPAGKAESPGAESSGAEVIKWRDVTLPIGTVLPVVLDTDVGSDISRVDAPVKAHLSHAVTIDGATALPENSEVTGLITDATRAGKAKGRSHVSLRFTKLMPEGAEMSYPIETAAIARTGKSEQKKDAAKIGGAAAGGAIIGAIVGGGKGAAIGGAVGGGAGTAVVMTDRGEEVRLGKGTALTVRLEQPVTIKVRG
jgi:hypothetical protein